MLRRNVAAAALVLVLGAVLAAQAPADLDKMKELLDAQQRQIQLQQQQLDAQQKQLDELAKQLERMRTAQAAPGAAPQALAAAETVPAKPPAPPSQAVAPLSPAITEREVLSQDPNAAARLDNAPLDPELRGFISIPGTSSRFRFGGFAKLDVIHDLEPAGEADAFITSTIPVDSPPQAQNTSISARQTRLSIDFRRPTDHAGDLRIYYENDFWGPDGTTNYHLRHAYVQIWNILAGYTYSTLNDVDAVPETLDYEGPGSVIYQKQPVIRYTTALDAAKRHTLAFGMERGTSDLITSVDDPDIVITPTSPWPDGVVRYRYDSDQGHLQVGAVFRSVGGYVTGLPQRHVFGWGINLSGVRRWKGKDNILFQVSGGRGLGRYIQDVTGLAPDVGIDAQGRLQAIPAYAGYIGYQHYWSGTLRSTVTYGYMLVDAVGCNFTTDFHHSDYAAANLIWNPKDTAFYMGIEYMYGDHETSDTRYGRANRIQFSFQYDLLKMMNYGPSR